MKTRQAAPADLPRLNEMYRALGAPNGRAGPCYLGRCVPLRRLPATFRPGGFLCWKMAARPKPPLPFAGRCRSRSHGLAGPGGPGAVSGPPWRSPACRRTGVGSQALQAAMALASGQGAQYLRLFVVENNAPALAFYRKNGFSKVSGCREEDVGTGVLRELGFEVCLAQSADGR